MKRVLLPFVLLWLFLTSCAPFPRFIALMVSNIGRPIEQVKHKIQQPVRNDVGLSILWIGHASMLIQVHDRVFLTDPIFTNTAGMLARRVTEPGLDPSSLTKVDYTLISHIHMDHFSYGSLDMIPKKGKLLIPYGAADYTPEFGFEETRELKPWDSLEENGVRITAVPARHFSGRYAFDGVWMRDRGYTGYVIEYKGKAIFVAGDTGYHPEYFKEIGRRFSIDVAIIPIAPVEPRDFMQRVHVDPKEALQIFEDVRAKLMIPMHHRTFIQGFDPSPTYAQELLQTAAREKGVQDRVILLDIGEQRILEE